MPTYGQLPFSAYENGIKNTYGFISIVNEARNIPPVYCDASPFSEGLAAVKKGDKWGFIDRCNRPVIAFQYDGARSFRGGLSIVRQGEFYGVIDKQGAWVIPPRYYDLMPYTLEGNQYFISRDSSFFQGIIDRVGNTILPHRYTYVMTLEPNTVKQRLYKNIPFYTVFREIDTSKGSFYEQFEADPFAFTPEKGLHTIYDLQFNKLASVPSDGPAGGFQHESLVRIDTYLAENGDESRAEKIVAIDSLLALRDAKALSPASTPLHTDTWRMTDEEMARYLDSLGYRFFKKDGKTGLKKGNDVVIPAQHTSLQAVNALIWFPREEDVPMLTTHYGGRYRDEARGAFGIVAVIAYEGRAAEAPYQYSLSGVIKLPVRQTGKHGAAILSNVTSFGFQYLHTAIDTTGQPIKTYGLADWQGNELLQPVYQKIEAVKPGYLLVTQQKPTQNGLAEHFGLFNHRGEAVIPIGVYSDIRPFSQKGAENLYLAIWSDPYPTVAEKKENERSNKTYVILQVEGQGTRVVNTFTAADPLYPSGLDIETGMLRYRINHDIR